MAAEMCGPQRSHLAKAGNIECLSGREDVVDATTDGIVHAIDVPLVVRLETSRAGGRSATAAAAACAPRLGRPPPLPPAA